MEITIGTAQYKTGLLNPWDQFHVGRKLAPILFKLFSRAGGATEKDIEEKAILLAFEPVSDAIAQMSREDSEEILKTCLRVCTRSQNNGWAIIMTPQGQLMFEDIGLDVMMKLTFAVIKENLGRFFPASQEAAL